jgi:ABC-type Na+ efflux pump permease subunit
MLITTLVLFISLISWLGAVYLDLHQKFTHKHLGIFIVSSYSCLILIVVFVSIRLKYNLFVFLNNTYMNKGVNRAMVPLVIGLTSYIVYASISYIWMTYKEYYQF